MFNISETGVCGDGGGGSGGGGLVTRSCLILVILWTVACQAPLSMRLPRQEYWNGLPFSSPGDLPTQGSNPGLLHCRRIVYCLSHQGNPIYSVYYYQIPFFSCWLSSARKYNMKLMWHMLYLTKIKLKYIIQCCNLRVTFFKSLLWLTVWQLTQ